MLFRVVYVMASVLTVLPVNATALDSENKQTFQLASDTDVSYQQWPGSPTMAKTDSIPPPPPGPYISSGLSDLPSKITNNSGRNQQTLESSQVSPLIRPDAPWPGQSEHPKIWKPEGEVAYAPNINSAPSVVNRTPPPRTMQPRFIQPPRFVQPRRMYRQPNPQDNFVRPQFNQPQMNQQQMLQQQAKQQQMHQQRLKQQQEKQQQMRQQQMNQQRTNQQAPVWNNFPIPMSNYPRQGQRARPPVPR